MKKNIFKYTLPLALGVFSLAACNDDDEVVDSLLWEQPAQTAEASEDYADISFVELSTTKELDPTDPTSYTLHMSRRNTSGAITVPITITNGADTIFTVTDAVFQDGDSIVEFTISFDKAEVGTKYTAVLNVNDPAFTSPYSNAANATFTVTRVKWNPAGYVMQDGEKKEGWAMYTEDFIAGPYQLTNESYPVELQERADKPGIFRLKNPYDGKYRYNEPGDWDDTQDYYIVINATNPEQVYIDPYEFELGCAWGDGAFKVRNLAGYYLAYNADPSPYYGKYENGAITFPVNSFHVALSGYNGGAYSFYGNGNGAFRVLIDPSKDLYEYTVENDFDWEEVFTGDFASGKLGTKSEATLYKGVPADTTTEEMKDAYERFIEAYGTPYILAAPYAEDYNIYFAVKDGRIQVLPDYELQETGIDALAEPVFARLNAGQSSWSEKVVSLNLTFTNEDESIEYGTTDEVLSNITWTSLGTTQFTDVFLAPMFGMQAPSYEVEVTEREDMPGLYRVMNPYSNTVYPYAEDDCAEDGMFLEINATDPEGVYITQQELGFDWGYGAMAIVSYGAYMMSRGNAFADLKGAGYLGTLKDGVITLPDFTNSNGKKYSSLLYMGTTGYIAGEGFQLALPGVVPAGIARPTAKQSVVKKLNGAFKAGIAKKNPFVGKRVAKNTMRCIQPSKAVIK